MAGIASHTAEHFAQQAHSLRSFSLLIDSFTVWAIRVQTHSCPFISARPHDERQASGNYFAFFLPHPLLVGVEGAGNVCVRCGMWG